MSYGPFGADVQDQHGGERALPEQSALYFDVLFTQVQARLSAYLRTTFSLSTNRSVDAANRLLGQVLFPRFSRVLFGLDSPVRNLDPEVLPLSLDLKQIRKAVFELVDSFAP